MNSDPNRENANNTGRDGDGPLFEKAIDEFLKFLDIYRVLVILILACAFPFLWGYAIYAYGWYLGLAFGWITAFLICVPLGVPVCYALWRLPPDRPDDWPVWGFLLVFFVNGLIKLICFVLFCALIGFGAWRVEVFMKTGAIF